MKHVLFKPFVLFLCISFALAACTASAATDGEDYPTKPIQLIVSYSAGAATDTQARIISKYAQKYLGQELVIVNKPGGGGQVGWNYFAGIEPDGYILTAYNLPHIISLPFVEQTSFGLETFEPIANWGADPTVFFVRKDSEIKTLEAFIAKAKSAPGQLTVGNAGNFVGQHLAILQVEKNADIELQAVPFQGAADALTALLGGHIDVVSGNLSDAVRQGDEVIILAIAQAERHPFAPDVPTFAEYGYTEVIMSTDRGIAAKAGTPEKILNQLEKAFLNLLNDPDFLAEMERAGADMLVLNRNEMKEELQNRQVIYKELLKSFQ